MDRTHEFFCAIRRQNIPVIREQLEKGLVNVNIHNKYDHERTALHVAALNGYSNTVKILIDAAANVNAHEENQRTPLHVAASNGYSEIVNILTDAKADVNAKDNQNIIPLHEAASIGHIDTVKALIDAKADVNAKDSNQRTPLHMAAINGHSDIVKILIDAEAVVSAKDNQNITPLHEAASIGQNDVVKILIEAKADVNAKDSLEEAPLHMAASRGHNDTVKILIEAKADINVKDRVNETPLFEAVFKGHTDIVRMILDAKGDVNARNKNQHTPLHIATSGGRVDIVKILIDAKADVNAQNSNQETPLHSAVSGGRVDIVKLLIDAKADVNAQNTNQETPLHIAVSRGHVETVQIFIDAKADVNAQNKNQDTPLHIAVSQGHVKTVKIFIDAKAEVNAQNKDQDTPLHSAASGGKVDIVKILTDAKAEVNSQNKEQETPLHKAASEGKHNTVKVLINTKADINAQNKNQDTPLHNAASGGSVQIVKTLIDAKADGNARNKDYDTPLHAAARRGHVGVIMKLLAYSVDFTAKNNNGKTAEEVGTRRARKVFRDVFEKVPKEIKRLGSNAVNLFLKSLDDDAVPANVVRCMFVGHFGVGKTTLVNNLLGCPRKKIKSTNGIDLHMGKIFVNKNTGKWHVQDEHTEKMFGLEDYIQIDVWDFAGQMVFYTTHQTHLSPRCLYFLVFDVVLGLEGMVQDDSLDPSDLSKRLVEDYIDFWIASITTYAQSDVQGFPKIVIVGTHIDKLLDTSKIPDIIQKIQTRYQPLVDSGQLIVREDLFLNASDMDAETAEKLRDMILTCGESYPEYGQMIPRSWNDLHEQLIGRKFEKIINFVQLEDMNRQMKKPLDKEELILCMNYLHSLGYLLFFQEEELKDHIILDPKWIIDALKCFITCPTFTSKLWRGKKWLKMQTTGKIKHMSFDEVLKKSSSESKHRHHLHRVMKKLDLVSEPKVYNSEGFEEIPNYYYIPCMVNTDISNNALSFVGNQEAVHLSFVFNTIIPPAVYNRLVASSLSLWPVFERHIYNGLVILRSGPVHVIAFRREYKQINVSVVHLEDQKNTNTCLCRTIIQFMEQSLPGIISIYNTSTEESKSLFHISYKSAAAVSLKSRKNEDEEPHYENCDDSCKSDMTQETTCVLDELFLMRVALRLKIHHLHPLAANVCNDASVVEDLQSSYPDLRTCDHAWLILMEWSTGVKNDKRTPKLDDLRHIMEEAGINSHILCKAIRLKDEHPFRLTPAFQETEVHNELLDAVADRISSNYIQVGLELGLTKDDILNIRMGFRGTTVKLVRPMLQQWYEKNKKIGYVKIVNLATALLNAKCDISALYEFEKRFHDGIEWKDEETRETRKKCSIS